MKTEDRTPADRRRKYDAVKKDMANQDKAKREGRLGELVPWENSKKEGAKQRKTDAQTTSSTGRIKTAYDRKGRRIRKEIHKAGHKAASKTKGGREAVKAAGKAATAKARELGAMPRKRTAERRRSKK